MAPATWCRDHVTGSRREMQLYWPNPRAQHWYLNSRVDCTLQMSGFTSIGVWLTVFLTKRVNGSIINSCPGVNSDSATVAWHCGSHLTFLVCFFIFKRDCLRWFDRVPGSSGARKLAFFPFLSEGREIARWTLQIVPPSLISLLFSQVFIIIMLLWYKILLLHYPILSKSAFLQRASCSTIY